MDFIFDSLELFFGKVYGNEDYLIIDVVFGLGEEIGGDEGRVGIFIGNNEDF